MCQQKQSPIVGFYKMLSFEYQAQQILNTFLTSLSSSLKEVDINQFPDMMWLSSSVTFLVILPHAMKKII